jgi:FkbM family methyltransferase
MVTREGVVWAYRLMLGREPESDAAIEAFCQLPDIETLRQGFLKSEEFAISNKVTWLVGYWVAAPVMNGKYLMWLNLGDRYMSFGCLLDNYEPCETNFVRAALNPGDVVVDAGANLGWYTLVASTIIGETGRVYAFEPRFETANYLEKTVALNRLGDRVVVHRCGLSESNGDGLLAWSPDTDNPGGSFLSDGVPAEGMQYQPISLRPLDDLALPRLDFLKVDVEGAEMRLFRGARQTLERCRPAILSELNPPLLERVSGASPEAYFALIDELGYRSFIIDEQRCGDEVRAFPENWQKPLINLALLPKRPGADRLVAALPGLSKAPNPRKAGISHDSVLYKLTHFRQQRAAAAGDASKHDRAPVINGISAMLAASRRLGQRAAADWQKGPRAIGAVLRTARGRLADRGPLSPEAVATALYRGILDREPDPGGLDDKINLLRSGMALEQIIRTFTTSAEFRSRMLKVAVPDIDLPDLTRAMPEMYREESFGDVTATVYTAHGDADIARMVALIERHRYYDAFGVWSPVIDLDKEITAAIVRGLGARSCFELGCFTGPVLSLLAEAGISVAGAEVSHTAFTFAYPNIREGMLFGDPLSLDIDRRFDVILCMDVLEHISPVALGRNIGKIVSLLAEDGFVYINSPMYGADRVFGTVFHPYLEEWQTVGDQSFWRHWPCDEKGWPQHGHLVWASVTWWSQIFEAHGLIRDHAVEHVVHRHLAGFFENAPARRSLFVLRHPENARSAAAAAELDAALARMPNLPRAHS